MRSDLRSYFFGRSPPDVSVARDPTHVGGAPEDVGGLAVEHPLHREDRVQQVAAGRVLHALGLAGGTGRIEDEEGMLGIHRRGLAIHRLRTHELVPPLVPAFLHRDVRAGAPVHDHGVQLLAATHGDRLVARGLQGDLLAAAHLAVGGNERDRARVDDALLHALRREPSEHDRMRGADARARLHRHHHLDRHRHVDEDALALLDALRLESVRELADAVVELLVRDLRHLAVVGLEEDRDLVRLRLQVPVEAVARRVQLAVVEPLVERRIRFVERLRERLVPQELVLRVLRPEALEVALGLRAHRLVRREARHVRRFLQLRRRREDAGLAKDRLDGGHGGGFLSWLRDA